MATQTKRNSTSSTTKEKEQVVETKSFLEQENEDLKKQMEDMKAQMELLAKQISFNAESKDDGKKQERYIKFISLVPGVLVLRGTQNWKIEGQFQERSFLEREARMIVNNSKGVIQSGYVYIADADFVQKNDLDTIYMTILNDTQLKTLLDQKFNEVIEIYKSAPKSQQDIIVQMIMEKKAAGVEIDANILTQIGKLCNRDLINDIEYDDEV